MRDRIKFLLAMAICAAMMCSVPSHAWAQRDFGGQFRGQQGDVSDGQSDDKGVGQGGNWREKRQELRQQLMNLPPEQRREKMQELRQQQQQQGNQDFEQRKQKFEDRWSKASPEQKQKFCGKATERCAKDPDSKPCHMAQQVCGGK